MHFTLQKNITSSGRRRNQPVRSEKKYGNKLGDLKPDQLLTKYVTAAGICAHFVDLRHIVQCKSTKCAQ